MVFVRPPVRCSSLNHLKRLKPQKTHAGCTWTTPRFFAFIRSALRRAYTRWPPVYAARKAARKPYSGPNVRQKWQFQCCACSLWFMQKETQVDHIVSCGSLRNFDDLPGFTERLLCEASGLQITCKPCHQKKTNEERAQRKAEQ